jgi:L-ascorbate metabolism protein UlaG (beta-lactamase superfamily)
VRFPISGPLRYTLTGEEAVELCRAIQPRTIVPVHYEGWKHFREGREGVERAFAAAPDLADRVRFVPIGETAMSRTKTVSRTTSRTRQIRHN